MFVGHPSAGWRTGVFYTLVANCTIQDINPFEFLRDLLKAVPPDDNAELWLLANYNPVKEQDP